MFDMTIPPGNFSSFFGMKQKKYKISITLTFKTDKICTDFSLKSLNKLCWNKILLHDSKERKHKEIYPLQNCGKNQSPMESFRCFSFTSQTYHLHKTVIENV